MNTPWGKSDSKATMFNIGDKVYYASVSWTPSSLVCPDCGGTLKIHVVLFDRTEYDIPCAGCASGYRPPSGRVGSYDYNPIVITFTVDGIEHDREQVKYKSGGNGAYSIFDSVNCFATEAEANIRAAVLTEEAKQEKQKQLQRKDKDTRSWAWHVHYYRNIIRRAHQDIQHAQECLNIAEQKTEKPTKRNTQTKAIRHAVQFLESLGYVSGDVHDDLQAVLDQSISGR